MSDLALGGRRFRCLLAARMAFALTIDVACPRNSSSRSNSLEAASYRLRECRANGNLVAPVRTRRLGVRLDFFRPACAFRLSRLTKLLLVISGKISDTRGGLGQQRKTRAFGQVGVAERPWMQTAPKVGTATSAPMGERKRALYCMLKSAPTGEAVCGEQRHRCDLQMRRWLHQVFRAASRFEKGKR